MIFLICTFLLSEVKGENEKHAVGTHAINKKPWLEFTKKWAGGKCDFDTQVE
jgi:hypothetical protein